MTPTPGGLLKLMAPFMSRGMRKGNAESLERLKQRLESGQPAPGTPAPGTQAPGMPATEAPGTQGPGTQGPGTQAS